jgi:hypothetical protein
VLGTGGNDQALPLDRSDPVLFADPAGINTAMPIDSSVPIQEEHIIEIRSPACGVERSGKAGTGRRKDRDVHGEIDWAILRFGHRSGAEAFGHECSPPDATAEKTLALSLGVGARDRANPDAERACEFPVGGKALTRLKNASVNIATDRLDYTFVKGGLDFRE